MSVLLVETPSHHVVLASDGGTDAVVVKSYVLVHSLHSLLRRGVFPKKHILILDRSPKSFREAIVKGAPLAVHAYSDIPFPEASKIPLAGEVTPLIAVPYDRTGAFKSPIHSPWHKWLLQSLIHLPTHSVARIPIQYGHKIHPSPKKTYVCDVNSPYVIGVRAFHVPEKIRINDAFEIAP